MWTWIFSIGKLLLPYFTENRRVEEECEHQVEDLQDHAKGEFPTGNAGEDMRPEVTRTLEKQEQQPVPQESQEADSEVHELESEGKQEKEDQVETFFSSMSHRYEEPLALWSIKNKTCVCNFKSNFHNVSYTTYFFVGIGTVYWD